MQTKLSLRLLLAIICSFGITFQGKAQDNESSSGTGLEFNSTLGSYYYQDALSSIIGDQMSSISSLVDIEEYILGPGDLISVNIAGNRPVLLRGLLINPQGEIVTPLFGALSLAGLSIREAEQFLLEEAKETFRSPEVTISLEMPRPVTVFVSGGVPFPGKHITKPFSRIDEAIYASIYPVERDEETGETNPFNTSSLLENQNFSFRNIRVVRADGDTVFADLYNFFKTGNLEANPLAKDGDQILVQRLSEKSAGVSISGAVINQLDMEYQASDTPQLLLNMAGGFKPEANKNLLYIFRNNNTGVERIEIPKEEWSEVQLQPNDRVVIPVVTDKDLSSAARIAGEVEIEGKFPIESGVTSVLDLLELSGGLTEYALPSASYMLRGQEIENQIPNKFNLQMMKRTSDQLLQGFDYLDLETQSSQNRVYIDLDDRDQLRNIKLFDGDYLFVPRDEQTVFVFGQVNYPGYYPVSGNSSVQDYIQRAGGYALAADRDRVFVLKAGINTWFTPAETDLASGDKIFVDRIPYDELNSQRTYQIQRQQLKNTRIQLIMTAITTITGIITTYVAVDNIRRSSN